MRTHPRIVRREAVASRRFRGDADTRLHLGSGRISDPEAKYSCKSHDDGIPQRNRKEAVITNASQRSHSEIEEIIVFTRLRLYNRGAPCGSCAILRQMEEQSVRPLPSSRSIERVLSKNCLTDGRTGYYPEEDM